MDDRARRPVRHPFAFCRTIPALAVAGLLWSGGAMAAPAELYRLKDHGTQLPVAGRGVIEAREISVDRGALLEGPPRLTLELTDGRRVEAVRTGLERREDSSGLTWRGRLAGEDGGLVVLTLHRGVVAASIFSDHGTFRIVPSPGDRQILQRIDEGLMPGCGGGVEPRERSEPRLETARNLAAGLALETTSAPMGVRRIDVMVLYTPEARNFTGSVAGIEAAIRNAVDVTNTAFANSRIQVRFTLVHSGVSRLHDTNNMEADLQRLRDDKEAIQLRNTHGADMVGLIVADGQYCGIGYVMRQPGKDFAPDAVQVTNLQCLIGRLVYAHEHGHNFGMEHDPANGAPPKFASFPWSFGHYEDGSFRTVMSYSNQCTQGCARAPHFSNPAVSFKGKPTGIVDRRDTHRSINAVAALVAGFRGPGSGGGGGSVPEPPGSLAVVLDRLDGVLSWEDRSGNESGFRVYRSLAGGALEEIAALKAGATSYVDPGLPEQTEVRYQVAAFNGRGEARSEEASLTTPEVIPVTVALSLPEAAMAALAPVTLTALTTGPAESAAWSYGAEGFGSSVQPEAPGRFEDVVLFPSAGTYAVEVTVTGDLGQTATATALVEVAPVAGPTASDRSVVQSVLFGPRGATGTFESNCWSHNAGEAPALVEYSYLARGIANPAPKLRHTTLTGGETLFVPNAVATLFGEAESAGAIAVRAVNPGDSPPRIASFCRSFVRLAGEPGSFGQMVSESRDLASDKIITGILQDEAFVATVLVANLDDVPGVAILRLLDGAGQPVGQQKHLNLGLGGVRFQRLVDFWPESAGRSGPFTIRVLTGGQSFAASATLLEKGSEDQIFIPASHTADTSALLVPRVAKAPSQFGSFLVSRLTVFNPSTEPTGLRFELWQRGQDNRTPLTADRTLGPESLLDVEDLIGELFGLEIAVGALRVTWTNAAGVAPRVVTVALNASGDGGRRFGMLVDAQKAEGSSLQTVGFAAEQSDLNRTDFGIVNFAEAGTVVEVTLKDAAGKILAQATLPLKPRQHLERNLEGIFKDITLGQGREWTLEARTSSGGPILTYLAKTNVTGDLLFVPGTALDP